MTAGFAELESGSTHPDSPSDGESAAIPLCINRL